jgi:bifunctional DNA-binding transcriptional regulator/antitoxin component of YhaV-PrlF toxin-antitoxin module
MKTYTANVLEICDNGDAIVELPEEMLEELGWKCGDTLDISKTKDNLIYIKKVEDKTRK